jgi:YbbR domain-containing protein
LTETKKSSKWISPKKLSDLKVVVLCIAAATTFWILNALNKDDYSTVVDYPVEFAFDRDNFIPIEKLPETIQVELKGNGWDLLQKYFKLNTTPYSIELRNPSEREFLLTSDLKRPLAEFLNPTQLVSVLDDSITFKIDEIQIREIQPILDTLSFSMAKNYRIINEVKFSPNKLTVKGPSSILSELAKGYPLPLKESRIDKNIEKEVEVTIPSELSELINIEEKSITIQFEVIAFLEGNKRLKLTKINFPRTVTLEDEEVSLMMYYLVDERKAPQLKDMEFEAVLNYSKRNREDSTILIKVKPMPDYLEQVRVEPQFIKLKYE